MNLDALLYFVPLGVGIVWLFYLVFRANLATQPLGKIISYFLGVLIIALAVGFLIDNVFPNWVFTRLERTQTSTEWQQVIENSSSLIDQSFSAGSGSTLVTVAAPTTVPVINVTAVPSDSGDVAADEPLVNRAPGQPSRHVVTEGDTLFGLADLYGVTVDEIMIANGLTTYYIYVDDELIIPPSSN